MKKMALIAIAGVVLIAMLGIALSEYVSQPEQQSATTAKTICSGNCTTGNVCTNPTCGALNGGACTCGATCGCTNGNCSSSTCGAKTNGTCSCSK